MPLNVVVRDKRVIEVFDIEPVADQLPEVILKAVKNSEKKFVDEDARFIINLGDIVLDVIVPKGHLTDLDSVPRLPIVYAWFKGRTTIAAVLHDYLYSSTGVRKDIADKAFLAAMKLEGVKYRYRNPIYYAVKFFGEKNYIVAQLVTKVSQAGKIKTTPM